MPASSHRNFAKLPRLLKAHDVIGESTESGNQTQGNETTHFAD